MDEELQKAKKRYVDVVSFFSGWKGKEEHPYTNFRCGVTTVRWDLVLFCFIFFFCRTRSFLQRLVDKHGVFTSALELLRLMSESAFPWGAMLHLAICWSQPSFLNSTWLRRLQFLCLCAPPAQSWMANSATNILF